MKKYIDETCDIIGISKKELAVILNVTLRTIDNYNNNKDSIPKLSKQVIDLLLENKQLKKELNDIKKIENDFSEKIISIESMLGEAVNKHICSILRTR